MKEHVFDATDKKMGRLASEVARILMGKNKVEFARNTVTKDKVVVNNVSKLDFDPKKLIQKEYFTHSGYIGSLRSTKLKQKVEENVEGLFLQTVKRMLPDNRIRDERLKRLKITK